MTFYTSLSGLDNAQTDLSTISQNIANASTTGFKKSTVQFADLVAGSAYTNPKDVTGIGSRVESIDQNFAQGSIEQTGSGTDLAISGDGFFTVTSPTSSQTYYTRNGAFDVNASGYLEDGSGNYVQVFPTDSTGTVTSTTLTNAQIPSTNSAGSSFTGLTIGTDGSLTAAYADGTSTVVGKIALASFTSTGGLLQQGNSDWTATALSGTATYGQANAGGYGKLVSGALEASNVDLSTEMVNLIGAQQSFQANAKAISTGSQINQTIVNLQT